MTASPVVLGPTGARSVAATVYGLLDRGARLRPAAAEELRGLVVVSFSDEPHADVRVTCEPGRIEVADHELIEPATAVDLEIRATLHDFVVLLGAPLTRGLPKPTARQGRAAIARIADGRVDFVGSLTLARRFLALISVAP